MCYSLVPVKVISVVESKCYYAARASTSTTAALAPSRLVGSRHQPPPFSVAMIKHACLPSDSTMMSTFGEGERGSVQFPVAVLAPRQLRDTVGRLVQAAVVAFL